MAKSGSPKNTKNKSKHNKLMGRKVNKIKQKEDAHKERLKALKAKIQESNL